MTTRQKQATAKRRRHQGRPIDPAIMQMEGVRLPWWRRVFKLG